MKSLIVMLVICGAVVSPAAALAAPTFLIFPPENLSSRPTLGWVAEALAMSIGEQIGIPGVSTYSRDDRIGLVEGADLPSNSTLSRASMIHLAQQAAAERLVTGSFTGAEDNLQIKLRILELKPMRVAGEATVSGPLAALAGMENELAWMILTHSGLATGLSRERFHERARTIPNAAYSLFIQSLTQVDAEERVKLLSRAVEICPNYPEAHTRLGQFYFEKGDCSRVIPNLESAGPSRENQFRLGTCYLKEGNSEAAARLFSSILAFVQSPQVRNNLGVAYLRKGDYTLAAESFIEALNLSRSDPTILTNLAIVRHLQGNDPAARSLLETAAKSTPVRGVTQFVLGIILALQGEQEQSVLVLAQAKRLGTDPEKLSTEDPRTWARPFTTWSGRP